MDIFSTKRLISGQSADQRPATQAISTKQIKCDPYRLYYNGRYTHILLDILADQQTAHDLQINLCDTVFAIRSICGDFSSRIVTLEHSPAT